jgi:hypothetical protein
MLRPTITLALASAWLLVAPVAVQPGAESRTAAYAANYGRGELVGEVKNTSSKYQRRRLQVVAGGREWTIHVPDNARVVSGRKRVSVHDIDVGTYIRVIGKQIGKTRLEAERLYIIGDRLALRRAGYRQGGYYAAYAGYRSQYRR